MKQAAVAHAFPPPTLLFNYHTHTCRLARQPLQTSKLHNSTSMASSPNQTQTQTHIVICPSAGIGHLTPFLRLASLLSSSLSFSSPNSKLTLILIRPSLSSAESAEISAFVAAHPHIATSEFHALPPSSVAGQHIDPFLLQYDAVFRSAGRLADHLLSALSPPPSAVFSDLLLAAGFSETLGRANIPNFTVITTSARFFSLMVSIPRLRELNIGGRIEIPGLAPISVENVPPAFFDASHLFRRCVEINCEYLKHAKGILVNTYDFLEPESIRALGSGVVLRSLPPIFAIGPLRPFTAQEGKGGCPWLDGQPPESVVYVSFGSRTALGKDQIRELGAGLEMSGVRFLWVVKTTIVDKEDDGEVRDLLGEEFLERTTERGVVVRDWVNQAEILAHPSIGGFVTHCGWNSVMEATRRGVPLLAWPQHGDQRVGAEVVETAGLGIWERGWGWAGSRLIKGEEIADKITELVTNKRLRESARRVGEEAREAWEVEGSSTQMFNKIIEVCHA